AMLAGDGADLMREDDPILQRRVFDGEAEVIAQPALAREVLRAIGELADDAAGHLPLGAILVLLYRQLVRIPLGRFFFADPGTLEFGHFLNPQERGSIYKSGFRPSSAKAKTVRRFHRTQRAQAEKNVSGAPMMTTAEFWMCWRIALSAPGASPLRIAL